MNLWHILLLLLIAGICGSIAQAIAGRGSGGCIVSIVLGFIGALLGQWLSGLMGLPDLFTVQIGNEPFPIVWSIIGATLFVAVLSLITGRRRVQ